MATRKRSRWGCRAEGPLLVVTAATSHRCRRCCSGLIGFVITSPRCSAAGGRAIDPRCPSNLFGCLHGGHRSRGSSLFSRPSYPRRWHRFFGAPSFSPSCEQSVTLSVEKLLCPRRTEQSQGSISIRARPVLVCRSEGVRKDDSPARFAWQVSASERSIWEYLTLAAGSSAPGGLGPASPFFTSTRPGRLVTCCRTPFLFGNRGRHPTSPATDKPLPLLT